MAFAERLQSGRDIVFTFGPWGFLFGGYHPATYLISVVAWLFLPLCFGGRRGALSPISSKTLWFPGYG